MKQALILAAGLGTRLRPLTDHCPKALVAAAGSPLLHHTLLRLQNAGFTHVVINTHHFAEQIATYVATHRHLYNISIALSDEQPQPLETGGAVRHAAHLFLPDTPVLVHNVDIVSTIALDAVYAAALEQGQTQLVVSTRQSASRRYLIFDADMQLCGWVNLATGEVRSKQQRLLSLPKDGIQTAIHEQHLSLKAFSGVHVICPSLINEMAAWPERFSIIDFYLQYPDAVRGYDATGMELIDVGKAGALTEAEAFLLRHTDLYPDSHHPTPQR